MRETIDYLDLLGRHRSSSKGQTGKFVGRDIIIAPSGHQELKKEHAIELLNKFSEIAHLSRIDSEQGQILVESAGSALNKLVHGAETAVLDKREKLALEAIVIAQGMRPVVNFHGGQLDVKNVDLGQWEQFTNSDKGAIENTARSIGRINLGGKQIGTGFVVTDEHIMTNRHVLAAIANEVNGDWEIHQDVTISFDDDGKDDGAYGFAERGVETCNVKEITGADFAQIDYAIIPIKTGWFGNNLPPALSLEETRSNVIFDRPVYVLGYPGRPQAGTERFSLLKDLFQSQYGIKRFSPGTISASFNDIEADHQNTVFGHDCTTLGGNSGSPVLDLGDGSASVVGIHFAGARRVSNYAHSMAALQNELDNDRLIYV